MRSSGSRSKQKGASYERLVCQRLSLWVSNTTREDVFWRAAMSGGRATLRSRKERRGKVDGRVLLRGTEPTGKAYQAHAGDIVATHRLGHLLCHLFLLECKHLKDVNAAALVFGASGELGRIFRLVKSCARREGRSPMLIVRQNRHPDLLCTTPVGSKILQAGMMDDSIIQPTVICPEKRMEVYLLAEVLSGVRFDLIRETYKEP